MKRLSLLVILVLLIGIVGCTNEDLTADYEDTIRDLEEQVEALESEIDSLEDEKASWMEGDETLAADYAQLEMDYEALVADKDAMTSEMTALEEENQGLYETIGTLEAEISSGGEGPFVYELYMVSGNETRISYDIIPSESYLQVYNVIGDDIDIHGEFLEYENVTMGASDFAEGIRVIVYGTVQDFQWVDLTWDENYTTYETVERESLGTITNTVVDIKTVLPEGLPGQGVQWVTADGETHGFLISYDGVGHSGMILLP